MSAIAIGISVSGRSASHQRWPFGKQLIGKPGLKHHCATNRCFTPSKLPAGAAFRSITKLIGYTSSQFAKVITAVLGEAGNYRARGCPPTRLAAADSISFKSACVERRLRASFTSTRPIGPQGSVFHVVLSPCPRPRCSLPCAIPWFTVHFQHDH